MTRSTCWLCLLLLPLAVLAFQQPPSPAQVAAQADRQKMMDLLHIASLRQGANGNNPQAPNAANYDESKANPYPTLPDPLVLNNGKKVTSAKTWWNQRRPEIVELFDSEIYGRVPRNAPKVKWQVIGIKNEMNGEVPVISKELVGHADNSAYPEITVDMRASLSTPANAKGPVPVIMEFGGNPPGTGRGFGGPPKGAPKQPAGPTWQQQVLARGWGYAEIYTSTIQADNGAGLTQGIIGLVNKGQPRQPDDWGELVENVAATSEYHWMAGNFLKYAGPLNWNDMPVDSHELVAMCAPRPVFLSAGATNGDRWVDAKGTFLAGVGAGPVYKLLGKKDMGTSEFPAIETPLIDGDFAFRQHSGGHTPTPNWPTFITFASRYIKTKS
ncbi:MAG: acetylxylan esterase [Bryobacteraceae bacterium]